jgi:hypothetical protein
MQLLIENPLSLDEFLNPEDKIIVNKDEDIFIFVINYYIIIRPGKKKESSNKKKEKEVKEINTTEALRVVETIKI